MDFSGYFRKFITFAKTYKEHLGNLLTQWKFIEKIP